MKEIRVRVYDIKDNKMSAGINLESWITGDQDLEFPETEETLPWKDFMFFRSDYGDFMLFTGVEDYNGECIFEDDILRTKVNGKRWVVEYVESVLTWVVRRIGGNTELYLLSEYIRKVKTAGTYLEKIGNIHQHPELLK